MAPVPPLDTGKALVRDREPSDAPPVIPKEVPVALAKEREPKLVPPLTVNPVVVALPLERLAIVESPETLRVPESTVFWVTAKAAVAVALGKLTPTLKLDEVAVTPKSRPPELLLISNILVLKVGAASWIVKAPIAELRMISGEEVAPL